MVVMGKGGFEVCEVELEVLGTKGRGSWYTKNDGIQCIDISL